MALERDGSVSSEDEEREDEASLVDQPAYLPLPSSPMKKARIVSKFFVLIFVHMF